MPGNSSTIMFVNSVLLEMAPSSSNLISIMVLPSLWKACGKYLMILNGVFLALDRKPQSFLNLASMILSDQLKHLQDTMLKNVMSMCSILPGSMLEVSIVNCTGTDIVLVLGFGF
eukprot:4266872-Ditylum_brightwellii.AAC.1